MFTVTRAHAGQPSSRADSTFTGEVWRDPILRADGINAGNVFFTPRARTFWHIHERGQLLIVAGGEGFVAGREAAVRVAKGDAVWTPPGAAHWHGACAERFFTHTAVSVGQVEWLEAVTDEEYEHAAATASSVG
jgi:quercetin dioxygenase-like cupin family protein